MHAIDAELVRRKTASQGLAFSSVEIVKRLFAVIRTHASSWEDSISLEKQPDWAAHARFMDGLHADGFIAIGGPLEGTPDVLLVVRAESEQEIAEWFAEDPWTRLNLLRLKSTSPWTLRLGSL